LFLEKIAGEEILDKFIEMRCQPLGRFIEGDEKAFQGLV